MSLIRPGPGGGYAVGGKVASADMNLAFSQIPQALDKTVAGDQLSGVVTMNAGGQIQASVAGGVQSTTPGGLQLNGGVTDWITYGGSPRFVTRHLHFGPCNLAAGWSIFGQQLYPEFIVGPGTNAAQGIVIPARTGWTLTSANFDMAVGSAHANVPAVFPSFNVLRKTLPGIGASASPTVVSLSGGGQVSFIAGSGAAWYAGGLVQQISFTCNQNNVIDESAYSYSISMFDESGANSIAGNIFYGAYLVYTVANGAPW